MPDFNIKISELNTFVAPVKTEDFFPLVDSSSMTTYKATLKDIGSLMTHSIFADTASYSSGNISSSHANFADSASHANTASYAISASHALVADSASFYPNQQFQASCSWASQSVQSLYATHSLSASYINFSGVDGYFPIWNIEQNANGNLIPSSYLWLENSPSVGEVLYADSASSTRGEYLRYYPDRPDYSMSILNPDSNKVGYEFGREGINTFWPIISDTFIGTDQKYYLWAQRSPPDSFYDSQSFTNMYFSGSTPIGISGSWHSFAGVGPTNLGGLSQSLNGHWIRIASLSGNGGYTVPGSGKPTADNSSLGEMQGGTSDGLIKIEVSTPQGNINHVVQMYICNQYLGGMLSVHVFNSGLYQGQTIKSFRMYQGQEGIADPPIALDIMLDGILAGDYYVVISCQSWGGIRFLRYANVDPWPPVITGSNDITLSPNILIFPAAPGFYSNVDSQFKRQNYYIQGQNVVIWPTANEITASGLWNSANASPYSLNVSGTVNATGKFSCNNSPGLTTAVTYGTNNLYFSGGILVGKNPP